jgi:hypothetical protein
VRRLSFFVALLVAGPVSASDVEVFGGLGLYWPELDTLYDASYVPSRVSGITTLFENPDPRSQAHQFLSLQGNRGTGIGLGLNVFPHRVVGFQFLFDRTKADIVGENEPQQIDLVWDSINFPNPDPVVREATLTIPATDTEGSLNELALSFNVVARFGAGKAVSGSVSSGLTYFRFDVEAESLTAAASWLGGHAVLFTEYYPMAYETATTDTFGFNVGGTVDFAVGTHAAIFVDGRLLWAPSTEAPLTLTEVLSTPIPIVPVSQIDAFLDLPPMSIDPAFFRILFGVKVRP